MTQPQAAYPDLKGDKALYAQIAEAIAEYITTKKLQPGDRLPSQNDFMRRYGVSQSTVRQALLTLGNQGLVVASQGKGVFVARPRLRADLSRPRVLMKNASGPEPFDYEFLVAELLFAPERVAGLLEIETGTQITRCRRKMRANAQLVGLETANFPVDVVQLFSQQQLHAGDYLAVLNELPDTHIGTVDISISAAFITDFDAEILDLPQETLVLQRIETCRNLTDRPVLMTRTILVAEHIDLSGTIQLNGEN